MKCGGSGPHTQVRSLGEEHLQVIVWRLRELEGLAAGTPWSESSLPHQIHSKKIEFDRPTKRTPNRPPRQLNGG